MTGLADRGNRAAQCNIGRLSYYGKGIRRDRIEAYKWFFIAAKTAYAGATMPCVSRSGA